MLKNLTCCGLILLAGQASGQAHPPLGLRPHHALAMLPGAVASPSKIAIEPARLPGGRSRFDMGYTLAPLPGGAPTASIMMLPDNRLVYYRLESPVATGASIAGALAGWLLGIDPQVQAYQQYRQFAGRANALPVPRQVRPDDLLR